MRDRLTVLITNIAFAFRSGTEIVVDQIARGLNRRGHRPIVFAPYIGGGLTAGLRLSGIAVVDRLNQVGCTPDVIHGQHNVTTVMALAAFPRTRALFACHDFDAPKDRAPLRCHAIRASCEARSCRGWKALLAGSSFVSRQLPVSSFQLPVSSFQLRCLVFRGAQPTV